MNAKSNITQQSRQVKHPSLARDASQLEIFKTKFRPLQGTVFTHFFKEKLWNASDKKCAYCGIELNCFTEVRVDHFQPKSKILIEHVDNYVCSCASCNSMKCNVDIEEFRFRFAVYNSSIKGIILPSQAKQLVEAGVELPIQLGEFYFEKVCEAKNEVNS